MSTDSSPSPSSSLKDILLPEKGDLTTTVEFRHGIKFKLRYVSRNRLHQASRSCLVWKYNDRTRQREQVLDGERFSAEFARLAVLGWEGVTPASLSKIIALDPSKIPSEKWTEPTEFSLENLATLIQNAYELDTFLQETCVDLKYFSPDEEDVQGNSAPSQTGS